MNLILIAYTFLITVFLLTTVFTFSLQYRGIEKKLNRNYIFFAIFMIIHLISFYNHHQNPSLEKFVFFEKLVEFSLVTAGFFFLRFFSSLTDYKLWRFLLPFCILILILIILLPAGIQFEQITEVVEVHYFWGGMLYTPGGKITPYSIIVIIFLIATILYVYKAIKNVKHKGDDKFAFVLLLSVIGAISIILLTYLISLSGTKGYTIFRSLGIVFFPFVIIYRNITNLQKIKNYSENLKISEERLRLVMKISNEGIWDWNIQTGYFSVSKRFYSILNNDVSEFSKNISDLDRIVFIEDLPFIKNLLAEFRQGKITHTENEFRMCKKDGEIIWVQLKAEIVEYSSDNTPLRVLGSISDITNQKKSLELIKESEKKFKTLFEDSLEAYLLIEDNVFIDCNRAAEKLFRGNKEDIINNPPHILSPRLQPDNSLSKDKEIYFINEAFRNRGCKFEWLHKRIDGSEFMSEVILTHITINSKDLLFTSIRDISEKTNLVGNLNNQINKLNLVKEIAFITSSNLEQGKVYAEITDLIKKYIPVSRVAIIPLNLKNNVRHSDYQNKCMQDNEISPSPELSHGICINCISEKRPININNCNETQLIPSDFIEKNKVKSALAIPIISKKSVIGILRLDDDHVYNRFKDSDISLFNAVADQIALFLDNFTLYQNISFDRCQLQYINERLSLLSKISSAVITSESVSVQINKYLNLIKEVFQIDVCILRLKNGDSLDLITSIGISKDLLAPSIKLGWGLSKLIFDSKRAIHINDMDKNPLTRNNKFIIPNVYEGKSYAGAPIKIKDEILGIIALYNSKEIKHFSKTDLEHLQIIANHIGIIIENNRLYSDITLQKSRLEKELSEKLQAQEELTKAKSYIEFVVNTIPVSIMLIDNNLHVINYNYKSTTYLSEDNKGSTYFELMFPALSFALPLINKSISQNTSINEKIMIPDENQEMRYFNVSIFPLKLETTGASVLMIDDVTEKQKIEQLMIQSEKMLSVAGLAAGLAHEINNPLGTIVQGCQNLQRRISLDIPKNIETAEKLNLNLNTLNLYFEQRDIFSIIDSLKNAASKAAGIIKNMLQFSRRSESKMVLYSVEQLIDEVIELTYNDYNLKKKFDIRSIKIIKDIENNLPQIKMTVSEIQQVLFNIIQNAAHAFKSANKPLSPKIKITVRKSPSSIIIEIEDNGPGIPEKVKSRIFEPFYTTKDVGEGTGLGLSVAYMIIKELHKGEIFVNSQINQGTTFTIKLPLQST